MIITVKGGNTCYFQEVAMEQNELFRLIGYDKIEIQIIEQEDDKFKFRVVGDLELNDITSLSKADFRFYTTEAENEPLVEIEKTLQELHDVLIYQSDALARIEKDLSKMFDSLAKSIKNQPDEWVKMLDYYALGDRSLFSKEEINENYLHVFETFSNSSMINIPTLHLLNWYRYDQKLPEIEILKNPDHIFYITYLATGKLTVPWNNLISALKLELTVEDANTQNVLLKL